MRYTLAELKALPTLTVGQANSLKIETPAERVWLSRCSVKDGEPYPNKVTVERLMDDRRWITVDTYQAG